MACTSLRAPSGCSPRWLAAMALAVVFSALVLAAPAAQVDTVAVDSIPAVCDTLARAHTDTTAADSTRRTAAADSGARLAAAPVPANQDSVRFWQWPWWGLQLTWVVGGNPAFNRWQESLPRNLDELGLPDSLPSYDSLGVRVGSNRARFERTQEPNSYNVEFPIGLRIAPVSTERHQLDITANFSFLYKHASYVLKADSLSGRFTLDQRLGIYSVDLGCSYSIALPQTFFSVDNTVKTSLTVGAGIIPLTYLRRNDNLSVRSDVSGAFSWARDSVARLYTDGESYGYGVSWNAGVCAIKRVSGRSGLQVSLLYDGRWVQFDDMRERTLQKGTGTADTQPVSFVAHRFALMMCMIRGSSKATPESSAPQTDTGSSHERSRSQR